MFRGDASTHNGRHGDVSKNVTELSAVGNACRVFQYLDIQKEKQKGFEANLIECILMFTGVHNNKQCL